MERINVLVFECDKECYIKEIDNTLEAMQSLVDGYIECVTMTSLDDGSDLVLVCNEEGKLKELPYTGLMVNGDMIRGTAFICKAKGGEFLSIDARAE